MANYCVTNMEFYSTDKEALEKLFQHISYCIDKCREKEFQTLLLRHGYSDEQVSEMVDNYGYFIYTDDSVTETPVISHFRADTETKWEPNIELFYKLLAEKYDGKIKMHYQAEEHGSGYFFTSDVDGLFFSERYVVSYNLDDESCTEYFTERDEALKFVHESIPTLNINRYENFRDIEERFDKLYGDDFRNYLHIDRYKIDYDYCDGKVA